jgi:hypothetical protein
VSSIVPILDSEAMSHNIWGVFLTR